jgi:hypothetical protein
VQWQEESLDELSRNLKEFLEMLLANGEPNIEVGLIGTRLVGSELL